MQSGTVYKNSLRFQSAAPRERTGKNCSRQQRPPGQFRLGHCRCRSGDARSAGISVPANNLPNNPLLNNTINQINDKQDISHREPDLDEADDDEKPKSEDAKQEEENGNNQ